MRGYCILSLAGFGCDGLGFDSDVADSAYDVVGGGLAFFHGDDFDGISLVMGTKNQVAPGRFHILYSAIFVFKDGVHVELTLAIGLE